MTVVPSGDSLEFNFVPSCTFGELGNATITNTNLNKATQLTKGDNVEYYDNDYYFGATITLTVAEGEFYTVIVNDDEGNEAYKGRIFVTDQTDYSINNVTYVERSTDNEYLTR